MRNNYLFISLNYHSYSTNNKIIKNLEKNIYFKHIVIVDRISETQHYDQAEVFCYTSILSQLKLYGLLLTFLFSKPYRAVVLPHFDIPLVRLMVSIVTNNKSLLLIVPDGVMFPSDFDYMHQRVGKKISIEKIKTFPASFYGLMNKSIAVISTKRDTLYGKSYVIGFGKYFWEYYKLLNVKKERYFPFGNPMFDEICQIETLNQIELQKNVTFFLQPFVEENWIDQDTFILTIKKVAEIFKENSILLILKLHPRQNINIYKNYFSDELRLRIIEIVNISKNIGLIQKSDFIMSYNSTVICDAILLKKDVIVFDLFRFKRKNEYVEDLKLKIVTTFDEIEKVIKYYYFQENLIKKIEYNEQMTNKFLTKNSNSARDIALFLQSID